MGGRDAKVSVDWIDGVGIEMREVGGDVGCDCGRGEVEGVVVARDEHFGSFLDGYWMLRNG